MRENRPLRVKFLFVLLGFILFMTYHAYTGIFVKDFISEWEVSARFISM